MKNSYVIFLMTFSSIIYGQVIMSGNQSITTCNEVILDHGNTGNYQNYKSDTLTIMPTNDFMRVQLDVEEFNVENNFDLLHVYDGNNNRTSKLLKNIKGSSEVVLPTNPEGEVTLFFQTDLSDNAPGFRLHAHCVAKEGLSYAALLFADCNYSGDAFNLAEGMYTIEEIQQIGIKNNDISSAFIHPDFEVFLFEEEYFRGEVVRLNNERSCLVDDQFNDSLSSVVIRKADFIPQTSSVELNGNFRIRNRKSGLYLSVQDNSLDNGADLIQTKLAETDGQLFTVNSLGNGYHQMINSLSQKSLDIDLDEGGKTPGNQLHQWNYAGTENQQFLLINTDGNHYKMITKHSNMTIEPDQGGEVDGLLIKQWLDINDLAAEWEFIPETITGDQFFKQDKKIIMYPNPVDDYLYVENGQSINYMTLFTITGEMIQTITRGKQKIDFSMLNTGIYVLEIESEGIQFHYQVIKK